MTTLTSRFVPLLLLLLFAISARAEVPPIPSAPQIAAKGWLLEDFHSGRALAEQAADERLEPASITKLMTAYVVFQALKEGSIGLEDPVTVSEKAWRTQGSRMFIEVGKQVGVEDLLKGMIIQSGNDASVALAEYVAGSEGSFAGLMNRYAEKLGMAGSHFVNATGLPDEQHYTTARDIVRLTRALIHEFPEYYSWYSERKFTFNGITQYNRNKLLWRDKSVDGVKTGHTESAGYCLVTSAEREGMRLISVVLGTRSENARANESQKLLNFGFRFFETHKVYGAGQALSQARVWKGEQEQVALAPADDLYITIPRGQYDKLDAAMHIEGHIMAPVAKGQTLGMARVTLQGMTMAEAPLVATEAVAEGGMWSQMVDSVKLMFE